MHLYKLILSDSNSVKPFSCSMGLFCLSFPSNTLICLRGSQILFDQQRYLDWACVLYCYCRIDVVVMYVDVYILFQISTNALVTHVRTEPRVTMATTGSRARVLGDGLEPRVQQVNTCFFCNGRVVFRFARSCFTVLAISV